MNTRAPVATPPRARAGFSLRVSLFLGFVALSLITGALGLFAVRTIRNAAGLVVNTYDRSLMSINYARAAAADFAVLRATMLDATLATDPAEVRALDERKAQLRQDLEDDLSVAAERAQSARAVRAAAQVHAAIAGWEQSWRNVPSNAGLPRRAQFDRTVQREIDLLVNYTAEDGFSFRQAALGSIDTDTKLAVALTLTAVIVSLLLSWPLGRRIIRPISLASEIAGRIAGGDLAVAIPAAGPDELGRLLDAMTVMRDSIAGMMAREVAQRRSAQARLLDAIESSREGVILVGAGGEVIASNSQAHEFFAALSPMLVPGAHFPDFLSALAERARAAGQPADFLLPFRADPTMRNAHVELEDGRTIRIGWSPTGEGGIVAFCSDMTEWREREAALKQSNLWLDAALANMSQGLCLYNAEGHLLLANRRFREIFGLKPEQLRIGMTMRDLIEIKLAENAVEESAAAGVWAERRELMQLRRAFTVHMPLSGGRLIEVSHQPMADGGWVATYEDATERHRARERILFLARHDALTGMPNRLLFGERLEAAIAGAGPQRRFALLCIDLDHFKIVNDTLGHPIGDRLLRAVAERFAACVRDGDTTSRLGGDEFAVLLPGLRHQSDAIASAERIIEVIRAPFDIDGHQLLIGASVGIAIAPDHGADRDTLLRNADIALYRAKSAGRSTWRVFEQAMEAEVQARRRIELELGQAITGDQLEVHYQPVFDADTLALTGFEALLRWRHPERGLVGAGEFIPVAEDTAAINEIGQYVLRQACRAARDWPESLRLAINVSPTQLRAVGFYAMLADVLEEEAMPPGRLELEVTESVLLANNALTLATLQRIKAHGIAVALDDFGTGYSSLSYLQNFQFDRIKIDQSFVRAMPRSEGAAAIVRAIVGLGNALGIPTTAEGVEDQTQLTTLRLEGCREVQGYLLGRPMAQDALAPLLAEAARQQPKVVPLRPPASKAV